MLDHDYKAIVIFITMFKFAGHHNFSNLLYPHLKHLKHQGGPSAGSLFEQTSMHRLTGVTSPISGGTGWVGFGWGGISKPPVSDIYLFENLISFALG